MIESMATHSQNAVAITISGTDGNCLTKSWEMLSHCFDHLVAFQTAHVRLSEDPDAG
jgi:hypothetical protein